LNVSRIALRKLQHCGPTRYAQRSSAKMAGVARPPDFF
jgi:hypothetical protein